MLWPDPELSWRVPVSVASVPLIRSSSVVRPAPSPTRGTETADVDEAAAPATGSVVSINSPRSFNRVRAAVTETGRLAVNVNVRAALTGLVENGFGVKKGA